ncbi:MAG TPA: DUF3575 domain-containing protein [Archangium sp.]|jgi:hypothetical protein|uniref:DUF3575 domain-containing protein n=1 Tax=Archangium sp. TaxID=1872627 RepID=UPI002ED95197
MRGVAAVTTALWVMAARAGEGTPGEGEPTPRVPAPTVGQHRTFVGLSVPLLEGGLALEGERELDDRSSVSLGLRVAFNAADWTSLSADSEHDYLLVAAEPGLRFYLRGRTLDGLWLGPRLELGQVWLRSRDEAAPVRAWREWEVGGAVLTGYSLRLGDGFTVQAALGLGLTYRRGLGLLSPREGEHYQVRGDPQGIWVAGPRGHLSVGWSF